MINTSYADEGDPVPGYRAAVIRALEIGTGVKVYDGEVPDDVEEDYNGYILPYVVLFSGDGDALPETDLSGRLDTNGLRWDFQTTSVGPSAAAAGDLGGAVRRIVTNFPLGTYHVLPGEGYTGQAPIKDTTINPVRFFLPRNWRLDTT